MGLDGLPGEPGEMGLPGAPGVPGMKGERGQFQRIFILIFQPITSQVQMVLEEMTPYQLSYMEKREHLDVLDHKVQEGLVVVTAKVVRLVYLVQKETLVQVVAMVSMACPENLVLQDHLGHKVSLSTLI